MALADELLDSISEEQFAEYMLVEENPHIVIDEDRNIILPERYKIIAAQGDHDMATYTFDCPRFSDGRDMSKMVVYINYIRSDGETGSYPADNVSIDAQDNDLMHFEWTPLLPATLEHGAFAFLVCVCRAEPDGSIKNHWSTRLCKDATISEGMDCHKDTIINMYPDVITRILERLNVLEDGGTTSVQYTVQDLEEEQKVQARKNIEAADAKEVSKLSEDIATKASAIKETASGEVIVVTDSDEAKPLGLAIDGKSEQDREPTPDNLIEIVNVGKYDEASGKYAVEVKCVGKNLCKVSLNPSIVKNVKFDLGESGRITANGTSDGLSNILIGLCELKAGKTYVLSGCPSGGSLESYRIDVRINNVPYPSTNNQIVDYGNGCTFTATEDIEVQLTIRFQQGYTFNNVVFKPMIRLAEITDDTYEPYKEITTRVLLDEPLRKGDKAYWNGGSKIRVDRYRDVEVFDGSDDEKWTNDTTNVSGSFRKKTTILVTKVKKTKVTEIADIYCDRYIAKTANATYLNNTGISIDDNGFLCVYNGNFNASNISLWKAHLSENPITVEYELATPITEEIDIDLGELSMFYPTTILSNDCNANMEVTYIADTKAYIDKKFAELATAMV